MSTAFSFDGCRVKTLTDSTPFPEGEIFSNVHLAFAGGGWRANSALSGWTVALIEKGKYQLQDIYGKVGIVSSYSGGSWFSTMLMFSGDFINEIESLNAVNIWAISTDG